MTSIDIHERKTDSSKYKYIYMHMKNPNIGLSKERGAFLDVIANPTVGGYLPNVRRKKKKNLSTEII